MYLSGFVVAVVIKSINKFLGRQLYYTLGASLSVLGSFLIITLDWQSNVFLRDYGIYGVAALLGGGGAAILVTSLSITADLIGNNIETGAFIYGAMSFTDKLSCGLAVMLINSLLPKPNQDLPIANDSLTVNFYRNVVGYTCGGCAIVGVLSVIAMSYIIFREESHEKKKSIEPTHP
jgi:Na+/melibiose symporter-like transporter